MQSSDNNNHEYVFSTWTIVSIVFMCLVVLLTLANGTARKRMTAYLRTMGVSIKRTPKIIKELKRKTWHFSGLLVPAIYLVGMKYTDWFTQNVGILILTVCTSAHFIFECFRLYHPKVNAFVERRFSNVLREREKTTFTGIFFFLLGSTITVILFSPPVAISAILFLIIGDFMAAVVGISFGRTRIGKKSLEGSVACFISCFLICYTIFFGIKFVEQLAFWGALVAAVTELFNPSFIDDNLSIPCMSGLAMHLIACRLEIPIPANV